MWKKFVKEYLTFSKNDRYGIICLVIIFAAIGTLPRLFKSEEPVDEERVAMVLRFRDSLLADSGQVRGELSGGRNVQESGYHAGKLFYFDPNETSVNDWMSLGVSEKTALSIHKYLSKGGRFRKPEDLLRIHSLNKNTGRSLIPYVRIPPPSATKTPRDDSARTEPVAASNNRPVSFPQSRKGLRTVEVNGADTSDFMSLPGIGTWRAKRIIEYRQRLGGFISTDQVRECYGIPDSVFQKIRPLLTIEVLPVRQININAATVEELKLHPYINPQLAQTIVEYRNQNGRYLRVEDLNKIHLVTESVFTRLKPYVRTD